MNNIVFKNEWRLFTRNKAMLAAAILLFSCGIYAIQYGHTFNQRQLNVLHTIDTSQASKEQRYLTYYNADTTTKEGKTNYKYAQDAYMSDWFAQKPLYKKPTPFASLSIGQNDNQAYYYKAWILNNIYSNKMQEIRNPDKLLAGNFDLSFVFLYLFPLFIIAFGYNALSDEKEKGTYNLLKVQGQTISHFIFNKFLFQFMVVAVLATLLTGIAVVWNSISINDNSFKIISWWGISVVYVSFWYALLYAIISFNKSSSINALVLVSSWVLFLLFIPAMVNYFIQIKYPENERLSMIQADRSGDYKIWELTRKIKIDSFYAMLPQYKTAPVTDTNTVDFPAYMEISQRSNNAEGAKYDSLIVQRLDAALTANLTNPVFATQYSYNQIAQSEINHFVQFSKSVAAYQQKRRYFIFDNMLSGKPFTKEGYKSYPVYRPAAKQSSSNTIWVLLIWIGGLVTIGFINLKKV